MTRVTCPRGAKAIKHHTDPVFHPIRSVWLGDIKWANCLLLLLLLLLLLFLDFILFCVIGPMSRGWFDGLVQAQVLDPCPFVQIPF